MHEDVGERWEVRYTSHSMWAHIIFITIIVCLFIIYIYIYIFLFFFKIINSFFLFLMMHGCRIKAIQMQS